MSKKSILLLFLFISFRLSAQLEYPKRLEIDLYDGNYFEIIYPFGSNGFMLQSADFKRGGKTAWNYVRYNTNLEVVNNRVVDIPKKQMRAQYFNTETKNYTLFKHRKKYTLVSMDMTNGSSTVASGKFKKNMTLGKMIVIDNNAFVIASRHGSLNALYKINIGSGKYSDVVLQNRKKSSDKIFDIDIQQLKSTNQLAVSYAYGSKPSNFRTGNYQKITSYLDNNGVKQNSINLKRVLNKNIVNSTTQNLGNNEYIFTGTYSSGLEPTSQGIFFAKVTNNTMDFMESYNYLDLKNFLVYLPENKKEKVQRKKERKNNRGIEMVMSYNIVNHDIIKREDGYILIGEAYYPTFITNTTTTYNGKSAMTSTHSEFDGYQYTHAFIAKFDLNGKLIWDQAFKLDPEEKPMKVVKYVRVNELPDEEIKLLYVSSNRIVTQNIDPKGNISNNSESEEIETSYSDDKVKWTYSNIDYWYDNYFLAYGSQKIKNASNNSAGRKRKVYFVSKVQNN